MTSHTLIEQITGMIYSKVDLFEDWGNLKAVPKVFQRFLIGGRSYTKSKKAGRDSPLFSQEMKFAYNFPELATKSGVVGFWVEVDGDPIFAFARSVGGRKDQFRITADRKGVENLANKLADEYPNDPAAMKFVSEYQKGDWDYDYKNPIFTALIKLSKSSLIDMKVMVIGADPVRAAKATARADARVGAVAMMSGREIEMASKRSLMDKLAKFKIAKSDNVSSPVDLMNLLQKNGIVDTVKVAGFPYTLSRSNLDLKTLKNPSDSWSKSVLDYEMDSKTQRKIAHDMWNAIEEQNFTDKEAARKFQEEYLKSLPPSNITFILGIEGLTIKIVDIKTEHKHW